MAIAKKATAKRGRAASTKPTTAGKKAAKTMGTKRLSAAGRKGGKRKNIKKKATA